MCALCAPRAATRANKTKFIELPLDELETKYDPTWLQEKMVNCQLPSFCVCYVMFFCPKNR